MDTAWGIAKLRRGRASGTPDQCPNAGAPARNAILKRKDKSVIKVYNMRMDDRWILKLLTVFLVAVCAVTQGQSAQEKTAVVFDQNIRYIEAGQGPPVILLHGMGGVKESWMGNFGALAAGYHVYAIDQIGFGHSDKPLLDYKIATFVDFLYAFMQTQNIGKATLVGNSFGGWIALDFAMQHPEHGGKTGAGGFRGTGLAATSRGDESFLHSSDAHAYRVCFL